MKGKGYRGQRHSYFILFLISDTLLIPTSKSVSRQAKTPERASISQGFCIFIPYLLFSYDLTDYNLSKTSILPTRKRETNMPGIPSHLLVSLREALADCEPLETNRSLRNLFADARLVPWRNSLPQADALAERVDSLISYLYDKKHGDGSNALVSLLRVMAKAIPDDGRPARLLNLADQLDQLTQTPVRAEALVTRNAVPVPTESVASTEKTEGTVPKTASPQSKRDFFISYNRHDREWAEWIAWQLENAGYTTFIQAWDFRPGGNFVTDMQEAAEKSERTIAVLSETYLASKFTLPEWNAAFAQDPTGKQGLLLPVKVRECDPKGLLSQIVYIDLTGVSAEQAAERLLAGVKRSRAKPSTTPGFPGANEPPVPENP
jgi:hypothetical protein